MPDFLAQLFAALVLVESAGDTWAHNARHGAYGCAQIRAACLADVNEYAGTDYTLTDFLGNYDLSLWAFWQYGRRYKCKTPRAFVANWRRGTDPQDDYVDRVMNLYREAKR
jgi:GTP-dependent phosphoenolpyruvate carboxykinase